MTLHEFINKRLEELGMKRSDLVEKFDLNWNTLTDIRLGKGIRDVTKQKLAPALQCSTGDIQACLAEAAPKKKEPGVMETVDKLEKLVKEEHPEEETDLMFPPEAPVEVLDPEESLEEFKDRMRTVCLREFAAVGGDVGLSTAYEAIARHLLQELLK